MSLTVACVWVKGNVPYGKEYVTRLRAMVQRHLSQPHDFVCLTDRPWELPSDMRNVPIQPYPGLFGWWSKIQLFKPGRFSGRVLYLDLDTLIVGSLDPIAAYSSSFALVPDAGSFQPKTNHVVVKRFNSSAMVWDVSEHTDIIYRTWKPAIAQKYWGDQDYIGAGYPDADTMPLEWFPRLSEIKGGPIPDGARVVLAKKPKPAEAARQWPWVAETWRAA